jgi:RHS repeat-associated protein
VITFKKFYLGNVQNERNFSPTPSFVYFGSTKQNTNTMTQKIVQKLRAVFQNLAAVADLRRFLTLFVIWIAGAASLPAVAAPVVTFTTPANDSTYYATLGTYGGVPTTIKAVADTGATITKLEFIYDGAIFVTTASASYTISKAVTLGQHVLQARATDNHGQVGTSAPVTVTMLPLVPPSVSLTAPIGGSSYALSSGTTYPVPVSGSAVPVGTATITKLEVLEGTTVKYTIANTGSLNTTVPLAYGSHTLQLRATDSFAKVSTTDPVTVNVTAIAPVATVTAPGSGAVFVTGTSGATVTITGSASVSTGATLRNIQLLEGATVLSTVTTPTITFSKSYPVGPHTVKMLVTDNRGITDNKLIDFTVEAGVPPSISVSSPFDGASYPITSGTTFAVPIKAIATPAGAATIAKLEIMDGATVKYTLLNASSLDTTLPLAPGRYALKIRATDSIGAITVSPVSNVALTVPPPTFNFKTPTEGDVYVATGSYGPTGIHKAVVYMYVIATAYNGAKITKAEMIDGDTVLYSLDASQLGGTSAQIGSVGLGLDIGSHALQARVTDSSGQTVVSEVRNINVVPVVSGNAARFVSQDVPLTMRAGQPYDVTVTMQNGGSVIWQESTKFRLGSVNPQDNRTWNSTGRVYYSGTTYTGSGVSTAFKFSVTAPSKPGTYNFQWQMIQDGVGWFGDKTENLAIVVTAGDGPSASLSVTPTNVRVSGTTPATLTFAGSGAETGRKVTKLEVFQDNGAGFLTTALRTLTGSTDVLNLNFTGTAAAGVHKYKLRSTDDLGVQTDSDTVIVNVTNSVLQGGVSGVRIGRDNKPQLVGWVCQPGTPQALAYEVLLDAPTPGAGGVALTTGVANISTEPDDAAVQGTCGTPGVSHHFNVDISAYSALYPGRAFYVHALGYSGGSDIVLPCPDNSCTIPGSLRIALATPPDGQHFEGPATVFMKSQLSGGSGPYDEVALSVDGVWATANPDGAIDAFSVSQSGLAPRSAPYIVQARVRQGNTTLYSAQNLITVDVASPKSITWDFPVANTALPAGYDVNISATATGTIANVKFYANGQFVSSGTKNGNRWIGTWHNPQAGVYAFTANALDANGVVLAQVTADHVTVTAQPTSEVPVAIGVTGLNQLGNQNAGSLPGVLGASGGAATYTLPLALPPGTAGMVPVLGLNYSSTNTTGSAGLGWSLAGLSNIDRCGKTFATDAIADTVRFQGYKGTTGGLPVDRLCLDGQRLVLVSGDPADDAAYWVDGAEYRTEIESFTRVTAMLSGDKRWFKVEARDGSIAFYGDTTDSYLTALGRTDALAHRWRLSRRVDRSGNYVGYAYSNDPVTGESKPLSIRWGGNSASGQAHYARVDFTHEARPDPRPSYVAGSPDDERMRLASISTYTDMPADGNGGTLVNTYKLGYAVSPTSGRSLLASVQVCGASDGDCLPATTFSWGKPNPDAQQAFVDLGPARSGPDLIALAGAAVTPGSGFSYATSPNSMIVTGDFNGDGKTDILERYRVAGNQMKQHLYTSNADGKGWTVSTPLEDIGGDLAVMEVGDFDGDGKLDLLVADQAFGSYALTNWRICWGRLRSNGSYNCDSTVSFPSNAFSATSPPKFARMVRDFNNDGRDDIFLSAGAKNPMVPGTGKKFTCLSNGLGFDCTEVTDGAGEIQFGDPLDGRANAGSLFTDMDGDGRTDLINLPRCIRKRNDEVQVPTYEWFCGNSAGEGLGGIQVLGQMEPGGPTRLNGVLYALPDQQTQVLAPPESGTLGGDLSADGYTDLVFGTNKMGANEGVILGHGAYICYSKGDGKGDCRTLPVSDLATSSGVNLDHLVLTVGDFDGDGVADVLRPSIDTWSTADIPGYQLCHIGPDASYHHCQSWTGPVYYGVAGSIASNGKDNGYSAKRSMFFGDFNGDGKQDIASYLGGDQWAISGAADQAMPKEALDKLISVKNGVDHEEWVEYAAVNDTSVYTSETLLPSGSPAIAGKRTYPNRQLVKAIHRDNGQGRWLDTNYTYAGYAVDPQGRGSLGFAREEITSAQSGIVQTNWPYQTYPHFGALAYSQTRAEDGTLLSDMSEVRSVAAIAQANGHSTALSYVSQSKTARRDLDNSQLETVTTVNDAPDTWGNIATTTISTVGGEKTFVQKKAYTFDNNSVDWLLGRTTKLVESRTTDAGTITRTTDYTYDSKGMLASETREDTTTALRLLTTYDRSGNLFGLVGKVTLAWRDPASNSDMTRTNSQIDYTTNGRFPLRRINALGHTEQLQFDSRHGGQTRLETANGEVTTSTYDSFGRIAVETAVDGTETWSYLKQCAVNCPSGAATVAIRDYRRSGTRVAVPAMVFSDSVGHPLRSVTWGSSQMAISVDTLYDERGRAKTVYWPRFIFDYELVSDTAAEPVSASAYVSIVKTYDNLDRVKTAETRDELGHTVVNAMTYQGFTTISTNPKLQVKTDTRDAWGRLVSSVDAMQGTTLYEHDAYNNLTKTTDPKKNVVVVSYDTLGRRTDLRDPDLGWLHYDVDPLGLVWKQVSPKQRAATDPKAQQTTMAYDALNRLTLRSEPDLVSGWTYDKTEVQTGACATTWSCGRLVESYTLVNGQKDFSETHVYDNLGRPATTTTWLNGIDYVSTTEYDTWGRPLRQKYRRGTGPLKQFDLRYDAFGRLARLERSGAPLWQALSIDANNHVIQAFLGNGLEVDRDYFPQTQRLSAATLLNGRAASLQEGYVYDVLGNLAQRTQYWSAVGFTEAFTYDDLNRLSTAVIGSSTQTFQYDAIGNITNKTGVGTGGFATYAYPASGANSVGPHAVSNISGIGQFNYDANGNLLNGAGRVMTWSSFDMPLSLTKGGESSTFVYGPEHQRTKQIKADGTVIYYGRGIETEVSDGGAATVRTYWPMGLGVEIDKPDLTTTLEWVHRDWLGSVVAISDDTGAIQESMAYDSWGKRRVLAGLPVPGKIDNKGYTGHEMLDSLELVHMNGRVYDPLVARFVSADPLIQDPEHSQSYNRYTYVWNNPTNMTDPTGFAAATPSNSAVTVIVSSAVTTCPQGQTCITDTDGKLHVYLGSTPSSGNKATGTKDSSGIEPKSANTNRDDIVRDAMLSSPNRFVSEGAACVGREGTCLAVLGSGLGGGWLSSFKLGQAALALFGFGSEVQSMADGVPPAGRGILNLGAGDNAMAGAINVDLRAVNGVNVVADATKLPFKNGSFVEAHSINPFGFNPVSAETARVMQPGGMLYVTGSPANRFAKPMGALDAKAAGFEVVSSGPMVKSHGFGVQKSTKGEPLPMNSSITTVYRRVP